MTSLQKKIEEIKIRIESYAIVADHNPFDYNVVPNEHVAEILDEEIPRLIQSIGGGSHKDYYIELEDKIKQLLHQYGEHIIGDDVKPATKEMQKSDILAGRDEKGMDRIISGNAVRKQQRKLNKEIL